MGWRWWRGVSSVSFHEMRGGGNAQSNIRHDDTWESISLQRQRGPFFQCFVRPFGGCVVCDCRFFFCRPRAANDEGMNPLWVLYSFLCLRPTFGAHCACIPSPLKIMTSSLLGGGRPFGGYMGTLQRPFRATFARGGKKKRDGWHLWARTNERNGRACNKLFFSILLHSKLCRTAAAMDQKSDFESLFLAFSAVLRGGGCGVVDLKQTSTLYPEFVGNVRFFVEHSR